MNQTMNLSPLEAAINDLNRPVCLLRREITFTGPAYGILIEVRRFFSARVGRELTSGQALGLALGMLATDHPEYSRDSRSCTVEAKQ